MRKDSTSLEGETKTGKLSRILSHGDRNNNQHSPISHRSDTDLFWAPDRMFGGKDTVAKIPKRAQQMSPEPCEA